MLLSGILIVSPSQKKPTSVETDGLSAIVDMFIVQLVCQQVVFFRCSLAIFHSLAEIGI